MLGYYEWLHRVSHPFVQPHVYTLLPDANTHQAHPVVVSVQEFMILTYILLHFSDIILFVVCLTTNMS